MKQKPEPIFSVLAEGGSLSISRITLNGQHRYLTDHHEMDITDEGLGVNRQIGYGSFEEAFGYINEYPWIHLFLDWVHEDYRGFVLERLMEKLNAESINGKYYQARKLHDHQQVLGARIYQEPSGRWSYTLEDIDPPVPDKFNY